MNYLEAVKQVVEFIVHEKGGITASELVEAARDEDSPAHDAFEWDDAVAGHEHRLSQARKYLRVVSVRYRSGETSEALVCVPKRSDDESESRQGQYRPISVVVVDPDAYALAERQFVSIIGSAGRALRQLRDAAIAAKLVDRIADIDLTRIDLATIESRMLPKPPDPQHVQ